MTLSLCVGVNASNEWAKRVGESLPPARMMIGNAKATPAPAIASAVTIMRTTIDLMFFPPDAENTSRGTYRQAIGETEESNVGELQV